MAAEEMVSNLDELAVPLGAYAEVCVGRQAEGVAEVPAASSSSDPRLDLLLSVGEECQTKPELEALLKRKPNFILYDGFEPSGRMHIAQGIFKSINVNKCTEAGGTFVFWVADWFALMNDKMGGDLDKIKTVGKYLIEVWKASGMDMSKVKFLWSSDEINKHAQEYWLQVLDIARKSTLSRIKKCCQIMGRKEGNLTSAQILYPLMQCTDIFFLKADICQLGVDQRKVNMLAREYCDWSGKKVKPIVLSHHMLYGLKAKQAKMSKSDPDSAIFMEDSAEDVERKLRNAYCPTKPEEAAVPNEEDDEMHLTKDELKNPCLDYVKYILFSRNDFVLRTGSKEYTDFETVKSAFIAGDISEDALKAVLIEEVNRLLEPVRQHFTNDPEAKEMLENITQWKKDNLVPSASLTRLRLPGLGDAPIFAVFAPLPSEAAVKLETTLAVIQRLQRAPAGSQKTLVFEDWVAFSLGRLGGVLPAIAAYYKVLLHSLQSAAPEVMKETTVVWQGEMIISGPSEYWISVINAGRRCSLELVRSHIPEGETLETAGQVTAALMHIGIVIAMSWEKPIRLCCDNYHQNWHKLSAEYLRDLEMTALVPDIETVEGPSLRLLEPGEGVELDVNIMVTDAEVDVNRKVKRAFCQPGNASLCPPISIVEALLPYQKGLQISRKPDNGGDVCYTSGDQLRADFADGSLHPGDLKPAVSRLLNAFLETVRPALSKDDGLKKATKDFDASIKAQKKK